MVTAAFKEYNLVTKQSKDYMAANDSYRREKALAAQMEKQLARKLELLELKKQELSYLKEQIMSDGQDMDRIMTTSFTNLLLQMCNIYELKHQKEYTCYLSRKLDYDESIFFIHTLENEIPVLTTELNRIRFHLKQAKRELVSTYPEAKTQVDYILKEKIQYYLLQKVIENGISNAFHVNTLLDLTETAFLKLLSPTGIPYLIQPDNLENPQLFENIGTAQNLIHQIKLATENLNHSLSDVNTMINTQINHFCCTTRFVSLSFDPLYIDWRSSSNIPQNLISLNNYQHKIQMIIQTLTARQDETERKINQLVF